MTAPLPPLSSSDGATATLDRTQAPAIHPIGPYTLPPVETCVLPNGLTLHCYDGGQSPVCRLTVAYPGGTAEKEGAPNLAKLAASMVTMGTDSLTADQINDTLDFNGAWSDYSSFNHWTSQSYYLLNSRVGHVADTVGELLSRPSFPDHETRVGIEKEARRIELNAKRVGPQARQLARRMLFGPGNPMGSFATAEEMRAVSPDGLRERFRRGLNPQRMTAWLSGRLSPEVRAALGGVLESLPATGPGVGLHPVTFNPEAPQTRRMEIEGVSQSAVNAVLPLPGVGRNHPAYASLRNACVALGGYFGSRLMLNVREDKGLTYDIETNLIGAPEGSFLEITTECDPSFVNRVIDEIRAEMLSMQDPASYTATELERLRSHQASLLASQLETPFAVMENHSLELLVGLPTNYYANSWHELRTFTAESLARTAATWLNPDGLLIAVAGK